MNTFSKNRWRWRSVCLIALGLWWGVLLAGAAVMPDAMQGKARIVELRAEIAHHDELYFKQASPEISDHAYDQLKRELQHLERLHPEYARAADSRAGDDRTDTFPPWHHGVPMLSLNKSYEREELQEFCARVAGRLERGDLTWILEPKFDGLAISITYEHGHLVGAATRGNGLVGDDVTANVKAIRGLPSELRGKDATGHAVLVPDRVELRGEVYMTLKEFQRINAEQAAAGLAPYANPRNLAVGTLKHTDSSEIAQRHLSVVFYGWGAWDPASTQPASQVALHQLVQAWGLPGVKDYRVGRNFDEIWTGVRDFQRARHHWIFPTDGVVLKVNDVHLRETLGTGPAAPNWAMAYKFPPETVSTRVRAIVVQVGRSGVLTPVAELEPVKLGGSVITRASLHNRAYVQRMDLRVGDWVKVEKAGEIIPQIAGVELDRRPADLAPYIFPDRCPECQTPVESYPGESSVRCPNPDCPAQVRRRLEHFVSANGVNIKGLGPASVQVLVASGLVKTPADLYRLDRDRLAAAVPGRTAGKLWVSIERSRHAPLWRFIAGLGIPQVGASAARVLAAHFQSLDALARVQRRDLITDHGQPVIPNLSIIISREVWEYFDNEAHRQIVVDLLAAGVRPIPAAGTRAPGGVGFSRRPAVRLDRLTL